MLRRVLVLVGVLVALVALDRSQRDAAADRRQEELRVRKIVDPAVMQGHPVAIVRVAQPDGHADLYGREHESWRCLDFRDAPALDEKVTELVNMLRDAQGVVLTEQPARPQDYGLDVPSMRVISLHGPSMNTKDPGSERIAAIDVGAAITGADGCYARVHGQPAIWTIDLDPASLTGRQPSPRPSLVDPQIIPDSWRGTGQRVRNIRVAQVGQNEYALDVRDKTITPEQAQQGMPAFDWMLQAGGKETAAPLASAMEYAGYLLSATWADVIDPAQIGSLGFDHPRALVTLSGGSDKPLHLALGGRMPSGRSAVLDDVNQVAFEIDPAQEPLLFPRIEVFAADATVNPWDVARQANKPK